MATGYRGMHILWIFGAGGGGGLSLRISGLFQGSISLVNCIKGLFFQAKVLNWDIFGVSWCKGGLPGI